MERVREVVAAEGDGFFDSGFVLVYGEAADDVRGVFEIAVDGGEGVVQEFLHAVVINKGIKRMDGRWYYGE